MLYDKPGRWAYSFQVKAAEFILSGGDLVIFRRLTRLPLPLCLPELHLSQQSSITASVSIR